MMAPFSLLICINDVLVGAHTAYPFARSLMHINIDSLGVCCLAFLELGKKLAEMMVRPASDDITNAIDWALSTQCIVWTAPKTPNYNHIHWHLTSAHCALWARTLFTFDGIEVRFALCKQKPKIHTHRTVLTSSSSSSSSLSLSSSLSSPAFVVQEFKFNFHKRKASGNKSTKQTRNERSKWVSRSTKQSLRKMTLWYCIWPWIICMPSMWRRQWKIEKASTSSTCFKHITVRCEWKIWLAWNTVQR